MGAFVRLYEGIDLSKVVLTHHAVKSRGQQPMALSGAPEGPKLPPIEGAGSGHAHERAKAYMAEIIDLTAELVNAIMAHSTPTPP